MIRVFVNETATGKNVSFVVDPQQDGGVDEAEKDLKAIAGALAIRGYSAEFDKLTHIQGYMADYAKPRNVASSGGDSSD